MFSRTVCTLNKGITIRGIIYIVDIIELYLYFEIFLAEINILF